MRSFHLAIVLALSAASARAQRPAPSTTFANPLDLDYRFMPNAPSRREAADPTIVRYRGEYWLFASKSGGYWHTRDFRAWTLVVPTGFDLEAYAPAVMELGGRLYYTAHKLKALYATDDPATGTWRRVADLAEYADPAFLVDGARVYLYHGSSLDGGISVVELDPAHDFRVVAGPTLLTKASHADHGWERSGPDNLGATMTEGFRIAPYVEGAWVTKHAGIYYLQYAAPGTVWKTYADGVYTSTSPMGPFAYAPYSPFSYRPGGFLGGAGHSGMFEDSLGNAWRVTTAIVSVVHKFERRLAIYPASFDADGVLRTDTDLGDYPQYLPDVRRHALGTNRVGWMLLSGGRPATASSTLDGHPASLAVDEDVRTTWSARTGDAGEWLAVDLGGRRRIDAVQVNFGDEGARSLGRDSSLYQRWVVETSDDGRAWHTLIDRRRATRDAPHAYVQLDAPVRARHVRLTNAHAAAGGTFSVRDLRVFGSAEGAPPAAVQGIIARRDSIDARDATVRWRRVPNATGYIVRYGTAPDRLYA
ncbi:MAG: family 43 glycosylhydrolase, partial [Gemmatirosa sp.]|nr:family 43 glycosylhydrolase [Gemmatirosa sp.]